MKQKALTFRSGQAHVWAYVGLYPPPIHDLTRGGSALGTRPIIGLQTLGGETPPLQPRGGCLIPRGGKPRKLL